MPTPKKRALGDAFRPSRDEKKPLGAAFKEGPRAVMPPVVVMDGLADFRAVAERHGWPKDVPDVNAAYDAAVAAGHLDLSAVAARYGAGAWQRAKFVLLPPVEGEEREPGVFRAVREGDVVRVLPPTR